MKQYANSFTLDATLARLRERAAEYGYGIEDEYCPVCSCQLTIADVEAGMCTNCEAALGVGDESVDEDLYD